ncbi:hypothetical protein [Kitasatospora aureofaciens]|uniref:hypothetical protein n=1 Tax=Kitasatospora aureofaciens TaxID=1894 RepID=UPI00068EFC10|nr:hypothetical protein [Kitasatospora aureofaciens]
MTRIPRETCALRGDGHQRERLVRSGPAQGITAEHVRAFAPTRDGVLVHTEESWTGKPVTAHRAVLRTGLDNSPHNWVTNLEHEAGAVPAGAPPLPISPVTVTAAHRAPSSRGRLPTATGSGAAASQRIRTVSRPPYRWGDFRTCRSTTPCRYHRRTAL